MDDLTQSLFRFQLAEVGNATRRSDGKAREVRTMDDFDLALLLQREELEEMESQRADRELARQLSRQGNYDTVTDDDSQSTISDFPNGQASSVSNAHVFPDSSETGEGSARVTQRRPKENENSQALCIVCLEMKDTINVPCGHNYCQECVIQLFTQAIPDEALFPVRCCRKPIPTVLVRRYLGTKLTSQVEQKGIEYATKDRTYCHEPSCATFIIPNMICDLIGTCPQSKCGRHTCTLCKQAAHKGKCLKNPDLELALKLAEAKGWQRCKQCQNMIELKYGCNHIT